MNVQNNGSPIKGRRISNQMQLNGKGLQKKTNSEIEMQGSKDLDTSFVMLKHNSQYENLKSHVVQSNSDIKVTKKPKKKKSNDRSVAIRKSQQLYCKKKKKSQNIKKSVSAERVKSTGLEFSYLSPEFIKRKKAATFFNDKPPVSLQQHRKQLGLDFLNNVTTKKIDKILERNRIDLIANRAQSAERSAHQYTPEKRKSLFSPNQMQELKHYMKEKKKFYSQLQNVNKQSQAEKRKQIDENLRSLAEVAAKRNSLSNSRSPPRERESTYKPKPLMLSYVAKKNKKTQGKKQSLPKSLKDQFKQLELRYKTLKVKNSIQTLNSDISLRESRDYETDMRNQAAIKLQNLYKRYRSRKYFKSLILQKKQTEEYKRIIAGEQQKWEDLHTFLLDVSKKSGMLRIEEILKALLTYADANRNGMGIPQEKPKMVVKLSIEKRDVFPPQLDQILSLRTELIQERERKEKQVLKDMLIQERISPRSFGVREQEIAKWGETELEQLVRSRKVIQEGWLQAYETINKTQKDLKVVQKLGNEEFKQMMPLSLSQSNLLKNQLNDLKMNLLRSAYSEENLILHREQQPPQTFNSNTSNKSLNSYIQGLEDIPLEMEKQIRDSPKYQFYVQTHVAYIRNYLDEVIAIVENQYQYHFLRQINTPIGPSPFEILRFFRMTEDMLEESLEGGFIHQAVLNLEIFTQREKLQVGEDEFMNELERIHNKSIFDAYNEALDYHRPFGIKGQPLPWRKQSQRSSTNSVRGALEKASSRVVGWAETLCGIIPPHQSKNENTELLPQIREERLDKMLNQEILENDDRWQEFDEELTEVALELSELVFDSLVTEILTDIVPVQLTQKLRSTH